jgi:DNA invertase Pin-like site-specific DNA recombinase
LTKITRINPNTVDDVAQPKLRVAAYCRVSSDMDDQLESLDAQKKHYESYINANPSWEYAGIYYDEGISGTKKEIRPALLQMIADCEKDRIDLIVTKSISRFARNTMDCLELTRKLIGLGIFILFEKENIHTGSMESELMLSILSRLAESESVSISENSKWSVQRRFQNGSYKISYSPYGYDAVDGKLIINEEQADIVRFIFAEILSGQSTQKVADTLNLSMIPPKRGKRWTATTIRGMVANERYTGDAIFQKTYTDLNYNRHANNGERDQYLLKNHHDPIISHEDFQTAQAVIDQRGREKGVKKEDKKYIQRYPFSGKIICSQCGSTFKRRTHTNGKQYIAWCCATHITDVKKCSMKFITDTSIEYAFVTMMNKIIFGHKTVLRPLLFALRGLDCEESLISIQDLDKKLEENTDQQNVLINLMTKGYLDRAVYKKSNNNLLQEAERLKRQKDSINRLLESGNQHLSEVSELLQYATKAAMLTRLDEEVFTRFVERVVVYSRSDVGFELKCGLTLKERLVK